MEDLDFVIRPSVACACCLLSGCMPQFACMRSKVQLQGGRESCLLELQCAPSHPCQRIHVAAVIQTSSSLVRNGSNFYCTLAGRSLEAAVEAYKAQGGQASIYVNDDGLQLLPPEARMHRIRFYRQVAAV